MTEDDAQDSAVPAPNRRTDGGSFRDPSSRVFHLDGAVYRAIDERALADWNALAATRFFPRAVADGRIVATELADDVDPIDGDPWAAVLRHERIPIVSYPYEWTFSMLRDAALLQLDLMADALAEDMILKDSTPYNVQWIGARPVFIDIGSFETLEAGDVWVGYRQFLRQYLYPLMLTARVGIPFQGWMRGQPEGPTADQLRRMLSSVDLMRKSGLLHVALPARAERNDRAGGRDVRSELQEAGFTKEMIENNVAGLRRIVGKLEWKPGRSRWNRYATECDHVRLHRGAKAAFITRMVGDDTPGTVWDVGANDGYFSRLVAGTAGTVLALDSDAAILDDLYRSLRSGGPLNVLPMVQDLADPSPGIGWRGVERPPLVDRSRPDLVLALAVVHHLVIGRNIPLGAVIDWFADLGAALVLEFVAPDDPMVQGLTANKRPHEIHRDYNEADLRRSLDGRFTIEDEQELPGGTRRLFALRPTRRS